jgi:hypothetical protein
MPRYVVEGTFPEGLAIPINEEGERICLNIVSIKADDTVTWIHSYGQIPRSGSSIGTSTVRKVVITWSHILPCHGVRSSHWAA